MVINEQAEFSRGRSRQPFSDRSQAASTLCLPRRQGRPGSGNAVGFVAPRETSSTLVIDDRIWLPAPSGNGVRACGPGKRRQRPPIRVSASVVRRSTCSPLLRPPAYSSVRSAEAATQLPALDHHTRPVLHRTSQSSVIKTNCNLWATCTGGVRVAFASAAARMPCTDFAYNGTLRP